MRLKFLSSKIVLFFLISLFFYSCSEVRKLQKNEFLLHQNEIMVNGKESNLEELEIQLYQKPNSKLLGFKPRLQLYNLSKKNPDSSYQAWLRKKPNRIARMNKIYSKKQVDSLGHSFIVSGYSDFLKRVGEAPVIQDSAKVRKSQRRLIQYFFNRGFYNVKVQAKVDTLKNKKTKVTYSVKTGNPFLVDSISTKIQSSVVDSMYRAIERNSIIEKGKPFTAVMEDEEKNRITKEFKNNGLYYFEKTNIKYDADTIGTNKKLNIVVRIDDKKIKQGDSLITKPFKIYKVSRVNIFTDRQTNDKTAIIDSITYKKFHIYSSGKLKYRPKALADAIFIEEGKVFSDNDKVLTGKALSNLKVFSFPRIQYVENNLESNTLTANIILSPLKRRQFNIKADVTTSNIQDFGISGFVGVTFRNVFKGAEILDFSMRGNLGSSSKLSNPDNLFFNVREYGADMKLSFPRIFFPFNTRQIIKKDMFPSTSITMGMSKQTNIGLDKESYVSNFYYDWTTTKGKEKKYRFDLLNLQFIRNLNTANYFNVYKYSYSVLNAYAQDYGANTDYLDADGNLTYSGALGFVNDVVDGSYNTIPYGSSVYRTINSIGERRKRLIEDNLILSSSFSFNLSSKKGFNDIEFYNIRAKIESAGNFVSLIARQFPTKFSDNGKKTVFGIEYAQYFKFELEYIKHLHIRRKSSLAFRTFGGIAIPYGNANSIPFSKSYFAGGSNDNRGWLAYSLGPGSSNSLNDFNEANFKLSANLEYRFNIFGKLNGALFADAGNIWNVYDNVEDEKLKFNGIASLKDIALGSGIGFRYDFGFFVVRTDFGFKAYNPAKEMEQRWFKDMSLKEGVFNIGINYPF